MKLGHYTIIGALSAWIVGAALLTPMRTNAQEQEVEELTRGPVHEAFAASVSFNPEAGVLVQKAPPELIEEIPPEQRPDGDNVSWIPGYWGWDEDQSDFIWISGIWRNLPPGRQWVPGYWGQVESQWQWTSGYWADEETQEVDYLPQPPKSIDAGPNVAAPSANHIWISGNWTHRDSRYAWSPGYWEPAQPNWIWIPAHYQWTPRGYVFIGGYWDYNVARRGVIFAPVRFHHDVYTRPGYFYTPLMVISLNVFSNHLFVRPTYGHYYFGDYYAPRYHDHGFFASYSYYSGRHGYDPIYAHCRWEHRSEPDWDRRRRDDFNFYRTHEDARPPHTWAALMARPEIARKGSRDKFEIAQPLSRYAERGDTGQHFQKVNKENLDKLVAQRQQMRDFSKERQQIEKRRDNPPTDATGKGTAITREKFTKSPLVAKRPENMTGDDAPPPRRVSRDTNRLDPNISGKNLDRLNRDGSSGKPDSTLKIDPVGDGIKNRKPDLGKTRKPEIVPNIREDNPNLPSNKITRPEIVPNTRDNRTDLPSNKIIRPEIVPNTRENNPDLPSKKIIRPEIVPNTRENRTDLPSKKIIKPEIVPNTREDRRIVPETIRETNPPLRKKVEPQVIPKTRETVEVPRERVPQIEPKREPTLESRTVTPDVRRTPQPETRRQVTPPTLPTPQLRPQTRQPDPTTSKTGTTEDTTGEQKKKRR